MCHGHIHCIEATYMERTEIIMRNITDVEKTIKELAKRRPVFHSEADFQFDFAREIATYYQRNYECDLDVRLEKPEMLERRIYVDIVLKDGDDKVAIELKYKTKKQEIDVKDEKFKLTYHYAQDLGRYYFWRDIHRLQKLVEERGYKKGFAVFLTNDDSYWKKREGEAGDEAFSLECGRIIRKKDVLSWKPDDPRKKDRGFEMTQNYKLKWEDYKGEKDYGFKYLICEIGG